MTDQIDPDDEASDLNEAISVDSVRDELNRRFTTPESMRRLDESLKPIRDHLDQIRLAVASSGMLEAIEIVRAKLGPLQDVVDRYSEIGFPFRAAGQTVMLGTAAEIYTAGSLMVDAQIPQPELRAELEVDAAVQADVAITATGHVSSDRARHKAELALWVTAYIAVDGLVKNVQDSSVKEMMVRNLIIPMVLIIVWLARRNADDDDD